MVDCVCMRADIFWKQYQKHEKAKDRNKLENGIEAFLFLSFFLFWHSAAQMIDPVNISVNDKHRHE